MKTAILLYALLAIAWPAQESNDNAPTDLVFELDDSADRGTLRISVYRTESDFRDDIDCFHTSVPVTGPGEIRVTVPRLAPGVYGVAAYYDQNDNDELDTNLFGIPKEAYGFAGEPASKWRRPRWEEISTEMGDRDRELLITLKKWKDR